MRLRKRWVGQGSRRGESSERGGAGAYGLVRVGGGGCTIGTGLDRIFFVGAVGMI